MVRQLITLPLRVTWRGAELLLGGAARGLSLAWGLTGRSGGAAAPSGRSGRPEPAPAGVRPAQGTRTENGPAQARTPSDQRPAEAAVATEALEATEAMEVAEAATAAEPEETARPPVIVPPEPPEPEREPLHIDDEPELVAESADPGAAEGAGAQVTIDEPWRGYGRLKADEIIDRLAAASDAELVVVELYETAHKRRRTVLLAVARQQRRPHDRAPLHRDG